jgi:HK97 family phage prohead protease
MNGLILEYKSLFNGCIKDIDMKNRVVTGYLADFDSKDHDGDISLKGSFKKSISERKDDIFFLNQHDWKQPHGKFKVLEEDSKGLYFESEKLIDTTFSMDALKLYEAGIVKEHSFGYQVVKQEFSKSDDANIIKEYKLYEGSNVTLGANPNTPFTGFKSFTIKEVNDHYKLILKAFRNGTFTDETFGLLEIALKQLQVQSYELGKKSLETKSADVITDLTVNKPIIVDNSKQVINEFLKSL